MKRRRQRIVRRAHIGLVALGLALVTTAAVGQTVSDPNLQVEVYSSGFMKPTTMAFIGPDDALVLEKNTGRVVRVVQRTPLPTPALDVAVNFDAERGLLGIAIDTGQPRHVFLYYTEVADPDGDGTPDLGAPLGNRVYRYTWNAALGILQNKQHVLTLPSAPAANHDGGVILLGPTPTPGGGAHVGDGSLLFVVIGDLGRSGQLQNHPEGAAPDDSSVILRLQQDGSPAPGNPFVPYCSGTTTQTCPTGSGCPGAQTCIDEVARYFAYGIRNSFGMAIDPLTGQLWQTENGPQNYDEVNLVSAGFNSGWNQVMGPDSRSPQGVADLFNMPGGRSAFSDPEYSWQAAIAPTAILFPVGSSLGPAYDHVALVGDANFGQLFAIPLNTARDGFDLAAIPGLEDLVADNEFERQRVRIGTGFGSITDLKLGPDGAVYVVDISGVGRILRISGAPATTGTPTPTPTLTPTPPTATGTPTGTASPTSIPATRTASPTSTARPPTATLPPTATSTVVPTRTNTPTLSIPTTTATPIATATPTLPAACAPSPLACRTPLFAGAARLILRDDPDDNNDLLMWKWTRGPRTTAAELNPSGPGDTYRLCIYDSSGLLAHATALPKESCGGQPCWNAFASGLRYTDPTLSPDGLKSMILKPGVRGRAQIIVRARGQQLSLPDLALLQSPLTVQLTHVESAICWGATFTFPPAVRHSPRRFNDAGD